MSTSPQRRLGSQAARGTLTPPEPRLAARIHRHREGQGGEFTARYNCRILVHAEHFPTIEEAIIREKRLKAWQRMWKIRLIEEGNPGWEDLYLKFHH